MATSQIISNRLTKWSQKQEKILKNQFGFQKSKFTVDCSFVPHSIITKTLANKKSCFAPSWISKNVSIKLTDSIYLES